MSTALPVGVAGYLLSDLERFLAVADERAHALERAINEARARRDAAEAAREAIGRARLDVATQWLTVQQQADDMRARAEADAAAEIERAIRVAHGLRAHQRLQRRSADSESGGEGRWIDR